MAVTKDMRVLEDLYRSQNSIFSSIDSKRKVDSGDRVAARESERLMDDMSTTFEILSRKEDTENQTGADRDVGEVANDTFIFERLHDMLKSSGRSEDSKYMQPVIKALESYLNPAGIEVDAQELVNANQLEDGKEEAVKKAKDNAFSTVVIETEEKMNAFVKAADNYISEHLGWTKAWTAAGKQRRALIRAARIQMMDQMQFFAANRENIRNNVENGLQAAIDSHQDSLKMSAHKAVKNSLQEAVTKREQEIYDKTIDEIINKIKMDEELLTSTDEKQKDLDDTNLVATMLNAGKSKKEIAKFDIASLYKEFVTLRDNKVGDFATSREAILAMKRYTVKTVKEDSQELKNQKAAIHAMYYIMTGSVADPPFIYLWQKNGNGYGVGSQNVAEFLKAYPMTIPSFKKDGSDSPEDFVRKAKQLYGENCLEDINYMKFVQGTALRGAELLNAEDDLWKKVSRRLAKKDKFKPLEKADLELGDVIRTRYVGIQKALNNENGILPKGFEAHKDIPLQEEEEPINESQ